MLAMCPPGRDGGGMDLCSPMAKEDTSRWAMDTAVVPCFWEVSPSDRALNIHCLASDMSCSASPGHRGEGLPPE